MALGPAARETLAAGVELRASRARGLRSSLENPAYRDTLAWALAAEGRLDDAAAESDRAYVLAPDDQKDRYLELLERVLELGSAAPGER